MIDIILQVDTNFFILLHLQINDGTYLVGKQNIQRLTNT